MNIIGFVDYLKEKKSARFKTDSDVARYLGTKPGQLSQWRTKSTELTNLGMARLLERSRKAAVDEAQASAIKPIVEFFPIECVVSRQGMKWELFPSDKSAALPAQGLRKNLEKAKGIYIFYDSRGRALYVGKTLSQTLWAEMKSAYNRDRSRQELFRVRHPTRNQKFVSAAERQRGIRQTAVPLADLATYFSAYEVAPGMIASIEALLIRAFANDLLK